MCFIGAFIINQLKFSIKYYNNEKGKFKTNQDIGIFIEIIIIFTGYMLNLGPQLRSSYNFTPIPLISTSFWKKKLL